MQGAQIYTSALQQGLRGTQGFCKTLWDSKSLKGSLGLLRCLGEIIFCFSMLMLQYEIF